MKCGAFVPFMELKFPKIETEEMFLVDRRNPANQLSLVGYSRWCRISSINNIAVPQTEAFDILKNHDTSGCTESPSSRCEGILI